MENSKKKKAVENALAKNEMVDLFKTTYHYFRNWVKYILAEGKVNRFRFVKNETGYDGKISVSKSEVDTAKKVLAEYKTKNKDIADMWW